MDKDNNKAKMVSITIDDNTFKVPEGITILEAARLNGIRIPTLCFLKGVNEIGACRICVVEVKGGRGLQASCVYPVEDGMSVNTNSKVVRESRKVTMELILSNHDRECLSCVRNRNCELQQLAEELNVDQIRFDGAKLDTPLDELSPSIVRNQNKCILCRRCVHMCRNVQRVGVIDTVDRGFNTTVSSAFHRSLNDIPCTMCGQCITVCPVGALTEKADWNRVWEKIEEPDSIVIAQTAPAVRIALGEEFGMKIGTNVTGKMVTAMNRLGFDKVFDTDFSADLTIMEEGNELIERINGGGKLPMITSCSPGWVKFCEHYYPDFLENLSSCKSPHAMMGATIKSYYAEKMDIDPSKIFVVSVMPCTAKKFEAARPEMQVDGRRDVDAVITTRELAKMIKQAGVDFVNLEDSEFDNPLGESSGAGLLFAATGGVMEAALRTVYETLTGKELTNENIDFVAARGVKGIKEFSVKIGDLTINAAVVSGLANAAKVLDSIRSGEKVYHFIEVMACPGGCVTGGGQPIQPARVRNVIDLAAERAKAVYTGDKNLPIRKSHENPSIQKLYKDFFIKPGSHKAHKYLHTTYKERENYPE
jgi:NADP-reducing hydrogenase subunit HndD